jgi:hypothetical protein
MLPWLAENLGTLLVTLGLLAIVTAIILGMRRGKKRGGSSCCGNCGQCAAGGACHRK